MTAHSPQPGDWVSLTAKVVELHPNHVDLGLELFSKTDQYTTWVRRDLCTPADKPIPDEPAMGTVVMVNGGIYQRLVDDHWYAAGSEEGRTWADLNRAGDVEVIHHG